MQLLENGHQFYKAFENDPEDHLNPFPKSQIKETKPVEVDTVRLEPIITPVGVFMSYPFRESIRVTPEKGHSGRFIVMVLAVTTVLATAFWPKDLKVDIRIPDIKAESSRQFRQALMISSNTATSNMTPSYLGPFQRWFLIQSKDESGPRS